jgi:3-phenylpropionate/trans-cinnamate dioxygenase ferredoxin reductase subunit
MKNIVAVGASLAGLRAVETLRRRGFDGRLALVSAEHHLPYDRPPLSKELLRGETEPEQLLLRPKDTYDELELEWHRGRRAVALDLGQRSVALDDGQELPYDGLLIATGGSPRTLPATSSLHGVHSLRTLDDALAIRRELEKQPRVAVVGAGFIGSEVAASCRQLGLEVTLVEALRVPLAASLGSRLGEACASLHADHGVALRCGVSVEGFEGSERVEALRLSDGRRIEADLVVVGIGIRPGTEWLEGSGLALDDGVVCDATCATNAPGVVAAGDVARFDNPLFGEAMRIEHWSNAVEQGMAAAARLLDGPSAPPFAPVPFFWSDQYDVKIQFAGCARPDDEIRVVHGTLEERRFVALYGRAGRLVGALAFNRPRQLMGYRRMLRAQASFDEALAKAAESS